MNFFHHEIFKCINFNYVSPCISDINLDAVPSFSVFSEFDYVSQ